MGLAESLKGIYRKAEDSYYNLIDAIDKAGIPVYKVVDAIEAQNIPSFPVAILFSIACLIALLLLANAFFPLLPPAQSTLTVVVQDSGGATIRNAVVTIETASTQILPKETDSEGKAVFSVPMNEKLLIGAKKEPDYEPSEKKDFKAVKAAEQMLIIVEPVAQMLSRTIYLYRGATSELVSEPVTLYLDCSKKPDFRETKTSLGGVIEIEVPSNCGNLVITPHGGYETANDSFSISEGSPYEVHLAGAAAGKGTVKVEVMDEQGNFLAGVDVSLIAPTPSGGFGSVVSAPKTTPASGSVIFGGIDAGSYYINAYDPTGNYAEYDGSIDIRELQGGGTLSFVVILKERVVGKIKILAKDKLTLEAVRDAAVTVSKEGTTLPTKLTDSEGKVIFNVGENIGYEVVVDKTGYLIESLSDIYPSNDYREVLLREATAENAESLAVTVLDERSNPAEDVRLRLKKVDGTPVGAEITTGADGRAAFARLEEDDYYVYAYKPGFGDKSSEPVTISRREENKLTIKLPIGWGKIEVNVLGGEMKPVAGASIKVINFRSGEQIGEDAITDSDGYASIEVRADKLVYLAASAENFLHYRTIPIQMAKDVTRKVELNLAENIESLGVEFLGLFVGEEAVIGSLAGGQQYKARLRLLIPEGATFSEAGLHLRTGSEDSKKMEKDELYIASIEAAYDRILKGTSYNPPTGYAIDAEHLTSGNAKWANITFREPSNGIIEVEAKIQVSEAARRGNLLPIWYRAWGKAGGYVRYPQDIALGTNESTAEKQGLYAQAKLVPNLSVGPSTYCDEEFCSTLSVTDVSGTGLTTSIIEDYPANISNKYRLGFSITSISEMLYSGAELQLTNSASALAFEEYDIRNATGMRKWGTAEGSELRIAAGDIGKNDVIMGTLDFKTKKEGPTTLIIAIVAENDAVSGTKQKVFEKKITVNTSPAEEMKLEILPKIIVPYIQNNILIRASSSDGSTTISNAAVTIKKDGSIIASGQTASDGIFAYALAAPTPGAMLAILAEKNGYKPVEMELKVSENILLTVPAKLSELLIIGTGQEKETGFYVKNISLIPLTIKKAEASADFRDYVKFTFDSEIEEYTLDANSDANIFFKIKIDKLGLGISKPKKIEGSISVYLENAALGKSWAAKLPVEIRIGFGGEVDSSDCFHLYPTDWEIFTSTEAKTLSADMSNNCTVDGKPVALRRLEARLLTKTDNALGEFRASSSIKGSTEPVLTDMYSTIAEIIEANSKSTIKIEFKPENIASGESELALEFRAANPTEEGEEYLEEKINVKVHINNLQECIEVNPTRINIDSCPYNLGYGAYGEQFWGNYGYGGSYGQQGGYGFYDPYQQPSYYGSTLPSYIGTYSQLAAGAYPSRDYYQPYYNNDYYSQAHSSRWGCGMSGFRIKNKCSSEIEAKLDPDYRLIVEDKNPTIAPGEVHDVAVQPSYMVGLFKVGVSAKVAGSKEAPAEIASVQVNVENELTKSYSECISVNPARKLAFNSLIGKPVTLSVINNCYNSGVRLEYSDNTISFGSASRALESTYPAEPYIRPELQTEGIRNMIGSWAVVNERFESHADGTATQIVDYEIIKNVKYIKDAPPFPKEGTPFQIIGGLRYFLTSGYYAVEGHTNLTVNFTTVTTGGTRRTGKSFPMVIQDMWMAMPYLEIGYGDPKVAPKDCIRPIALDLKNVYADFPGKCMPMEEIDNFTVAPFSTADAGGLFNFAKSTATIEEKGGCGTVDRISQLLIDSIEKNGMKFIFSVTEDGHNIRMRIEKANWNGKGFELSEPILVVVTRMVPAQSARVAIPVKLCVPGAEGIVQPTGPAGIECDSGKGMTGKTAYEKYGFDRLLLDWRWSESYDKDGTTIKAKDLCDDADKTYFCDAAQFSIAVHEKAAIGWKFMNDNKSKFKGCETKNSLNFHSCALEKITVTEKTGDETFNVFLDKGGKVLENKTGICAEEFKKLQNLTALKNMQITPSSNDEQHYKNIINKTQELLEELNNQQHQTCAKRIVAEVDATQFSDGLVPILTGIGAEKVEMKSGSYYLTFDEYYKVHTALSTCINDERCCTILKTNNSHEISISSTSQVTITTPFLNALYKGVKFKLAVVEGLMNDAEREFAMKEGALNDGISLPPGYSNLLELYRDVVEFNVMLIKDGYSQDFMNDFWKAFENDARGKDKLKTLKFENAGSRKVFVKDNMGGGALEKLEYAGRYNINLVYDWSAPSSEYATVVVKQLKDGKLADIDRQNKEKGSETEYARNPFFYYPIDGTLGFKGYGGGDSSSRDGYGTSFSFANENSKNKFYFNNYQIGELGPTPETSTGSAIGSIRVGYSNLYANMKNGQILSLENGTLNFTPSNPIRLALSIEKTSTGERPVGFLYFLTTGLEPKIAGEGTISWSIDKDEVSGTSGSQADRLYTADYICGGRGTERYPGLAFLSNNRGTVEASSVIYMPAREAPVTSTTLELRCIKDRLNHAKAYDFTGSVENKITSTGSLALVTDGKNRLRENYTLKQLLGMIKSADGSEGSVCVEVGGSSGDTIKLYWNGKTIKEKAG